MKYAQAIILAGGKSQEDIYQHFGVSCVADLPVNGRRMVEVVAQAFQDAGVSRIITVGASVDNCKSASAGEAFVDSLRNGIQQTDNKGLIFVAACDMPFITSQEVAEFAGRYNRSGLYCAVVPVKSCRDRYPALARTALTVSEGEFTLGNVFMADRWAWQSALGVAEQAYNVRKSKLKLALLLGLPTTWRYLRAKKRPSCLTIAQLEQRAFELTKCPVTAAIGDWPGIGTDVDSLGHFRAAQQYMTDPTHGS